MRIVVTGGGGIGSAVTEELRGLGHELVVIDVDPARADVVGDITAPDTWIDALEGADVVVHTAAIVDEFGGPYTDTKVAAERQALRIGMETDLEMVVVRPGDVYGPGSVPWTIRPVGLLRRGLFALPAGGTGILSPVHVQDIARGITVAATHPAARNRIYNMSGGEAVTAERDDRVRDPSRQLLHRAGTRRARLGAAAVPRGWHAFDARLGRPAPSRLKALPAGSSAVLDGPVVACGDRLEAATGDLGGERGGRDLDDLVADVDEVELAAAAHAFDLAPRSPDDHGPVPGRHAHTTLRHRDDASALLRRDGRQFPSDRPAFEDVAHQEQTCSEQPQPPQQTRTEEHPAGDRQQADAERPPPVAATRWPTCPTGEPSGDRLPVHFRLELEQHRAVVVHRGERRTCGTAGGDIHNFHSGNHSDVFIHSRPA